MEYLHSMLRISDVYESLAFFGLLGFVEVARSDNEAGRYSNIFICAEEDLERARARQTPMLELTYNWDGESEKGGESWEGRYFGHLAYRVDNIYAVCERLRAAGVVINRPPRDGYMAFVRTPDNISIELLQKGEALPPQEPWVSMANIGKW